MGHKMSPIRVFATKDKDTPFLREVWLVCEDCRKIFEKFEVFADRLTLEFRNSKPLCRDCYEKRKNH